MPKTSNSTVEKSKHQFERGIPTVTKLYSCTIIDVHPESQTVDVILTRNSKTVRGVSILSDFAGENCANITMPERYTEAVLGSMGDNTDPFIVAYKPRSSRKNKGYFSHEIQEGESQKVFRGQSFIKNDAYGGTHISSGASDWIVVSDFGIYDESTQRTISAIESVNISVTEYEQKSKAYSKGDIKNNEAIIDEIVAEAKALASATIEKKDTSVFGMLEKIEENNANFDLLKSIKSKINEFVGEERNINEINITKDGIDIVAKKLFLNHQNIHLLFQGFTASKVQTETGLTRTVNDVERAGVTKTTEYIYSTNSENDEYICKFSTFTFEGDANYIEEELEINGGDKYLRKTWLNYVDGDKKYDMYSEVSKIAEDGDE